MIMNTIIINVTILV